MKVAMILAAGRGERLRPFTDNHPKALCRIHEIPLIEYHVKRLALAGFERLIINHAHLGGQIRQHLGTGERFGIELVYVPEPPGALETGGGIVNALPLLGHEPFLTVNADIFTDYSFASLSLAKTSAVHLVLVNKPSYLSQGDFGLSNQGLLLNTPGQFTFAGITIYRPEVFNDCKPGRYSVTPLLRQLALKRLATGEVYQGQWVDIGTPERFRLANANP